MTPEEQKILNGAKEIEKELYTSGKAFIVDSKKMLGKGKLIDIRPHTRFTPFPAHTHNYVEIMYMCRGSTHHVINGGIQVTLEQGDLLMLNQRSSHEILPASRSDIGVNFIILPEFLDGALRMLGPETCLLYTSRKSAGRWILQIGSCVKQRGDTNPMGMALL